MCLFSAFFMKKHHKRARRFESSFYTAIKLSMLDKALDSKQKKQKLPTNKNYLMIGQKSTKAGQII